MLITAAWLLEVLSVTCAVCGILYNFLGIWTGFKFISHRRAPSRRMPSNNWHPPVSILKPLKGTDPEMYESFRSHCLLDYPAYEILFGVADPGDPALPLVERLKSEFPDRDIRVFICPNILGSNVKISNLAQLLPRAKYEYLVVNDSDIRVEPDYLCEVIAPFSDARVGMVTCLYRGVAGATLGSKLEALGISTDFCAGVLIAHALEGGLRFALGSTLAVRRQDLMQIGGFEAFVDYLADDYELGTRIAQSGKRVQLAGTLVETFLPSYSWRDYARHQLRWARGIRNSRPWGYFGLGFTYVVPWALLAIVLARGVWWSWLLLATGLIARFAMAFTVAGSILRDQQLHRFWWLIPIRDCLALALWVMGYCGRTVHWRGDRFTLNNGKLVRARDQDFVRS